MKRTVIIAWTSLVTVGSIGVIFVLSHLWILGIGAALQPPISKPYIQSQKIWLPESYRNESEVEVKQRVSSNPVHPLSQQLIEEYVAPAKFKMLSSALEVSVGVVNGPILEVQYYGVKENFFFKTSEKFYKASDSGDVIAKGKIEGRDLHIEWVDNPDTSYEEVCVTFAVVLAIFCCGVFTIVLLLVSGMVYAIGFAWWIPWTDKKP